VKFKVLFGAALLWPLASWAADDIRPIDAKVGLWEYTVTTEISGMPAMPVPQIPPEALASMTPEQRARVEGMMKGGARPNTMRVCLTRESLSKGLAANNSPNNSCTTKVLSSSDSKQVVHMECTQEHGKTTTTTTGDWTIERTDAEHIKGIASMKFSGDRPMETKLTLNGKWVSADCGDVKPIGEK